MSVYSSSIFFLTHVQRRRRRRELQWHSTDEIYAMSILDYLCCGRYIEEKSMNELIISGRAIYCRHTWVRLVFVYTLILVFSSVLIYGNRSSFSNQTHDVVLYANQYQVYDDNMPCNRGDSMENNKQHAVEFEEISKTNGC